MACEACRDTGLPCRACGDTNDIDSGPPDADRGQMRLTIPIHPNLLAQLSILSRTGVLGDTPAEVAQHMIRESVRTELVDGLLASSSVPAVVVEQPEWAPSPLTREQRQERR